MYTTRWWRLAGCEPISFAWAGCGPIGRERWVGTYETRGRRGFGSGALGVRRPLRFLAWKLDLDDEQLAGIARILGELKTERAQADVDRDRMTAALADAVSAETFDGNRATEAAALRVASAERLRDATVRALRELHTLLHPEQRRTLGYLIRTGMISL